MTTRKYFSAYFGDKWRQKTMKKNSQYFVCEKCYYNRYKNVYLLEK